MRTQEIAHSAGQMTKIRSRLGDLVNPADEIKKPKGMRTKRFEASIKRLKKHELAFLQKLADGLKRYADQSRQ